MRVLFIDIDTLRPDHMSCYGYHRETTPNLDKVCRQGVRFDNYYTSDAPCLPSRASLISGMFGFRNGAVGHGGTAAERRVRGDERGFGYIKDEGCFHQIFRKAGMHTASISTFPERHSIWWFNAGLNECHNVGKRGRNPARKYCLWLWTGSSARDAMTTGICMCIYGTRIRLIERPKASKSRLEMTRYRIG